MVDSSSGIDVGSFLAQLESWADQQGWPVTTHPYGAHAEQVADLRLPEHDGSHPVAVILHGGFWRAAFGRASTTALAVDLAQRGWATWNVEYRRVGCGGGVPETLDDVGAAIDELDRVDACLDRSHIIAIGHSAGGQLALWAAGTRKVAASVTLAGVCDLTNAATARLGDGAVVAFTGGTPAERPGAYDAADPMRRLPTGVPQLLVHGSRDDRVSIEQSRRYAQAALEAGDRAEVLELPESGHFDLIDPRSEAWHTVAVRLNSLTSSGPRDRRRTRTGPAPTRTADADVS